jgi:hypothetical protein
MPISSVSKVYDAPDPIMETDLELLAKVNTYEQSKFDAGAQALQQEVNNWALMSNIAKPELREYANQKLNKLVSGIDNMGGVNLGDINNVNSLKSLGYNIYADKRITDGVATTQKMKQLQAASQTKLSGKDAGKYDSAVADYLMKGYSDWASDGDPNNARYDGPTDLPEGNMNTINKKVQDYLKELKPDSDSTPSGDLQKSYGYFQVDGKWLKGNRIDEAISAVTDENDALVFRSHGWKALGGDSDHGLVSKLGVVYDNTSASIKGQINYLQGELNQTTDGGRRLELTNLISQQKQALATNDKEKAQWFSKQTLSPQERDGIQESLYHNAWKANVTNSYAYNQQKTELKTNMPLIFHDRMDIQAKQWAADYNIKLATLDLQQQTLDLKAQELGLKYTNTLGGLNVPLTQEATNNANNQEKSPASFMDNINSKYFGLNTGYYQYLYNVMGANDSNGRFENVGGVWKPKQQYQAQIQNEINALTTKLDNYSTLTDDEKKNLNLPIGEDELKDLFNVRHQINTYGAYQQMAHDKEDEIMHNALANGTIEKDWRTVPVTVGGKTSTAEEVLALYNSGVYTDATPIEAINGKAITTGKGGSLVSYAKTAIKEMATAMGIPTSSVSDNFTMKSLKEVADKSREKAKKSYEQVGGKMFNSYSVPLPFTSIAKPTQEIIQKQLADKVGEDDPKNINPIKGYIQMNFETGKPEYKVEVKSGTGKKVKSSTIDVTDMIQTPGGIGMYFPKSDVSLIWGLSLSNNGSTPFSQKDNYKNALRTSEGNYPYQISAMPNALNGTTGLKVKVALPVGDGTTVEVNVKNMQNGSFVFPSSLEAVQQYLNDWMSTPELKERFYKEHGLTLNK